jgi:glycosyltransferase involved in cell wall biosynthesis
MARLSLKDFGPAVMSNGSKKNFLFFGVIQYNKGVDFLIEAANMLAEEYSGFTVTIAGKCDDFEPYRQKIKHPGVFNLIIKVVPNSDIPALFGNASFLVLPYRDVTQSGPLQIAFNYNIPVIASDFPGFREYIIPGETGLLFEPNNPKSLYEVMKTALNYSEDKIVQIKKTQAEFVTREISNGNIGHRYVEFFEKLLVK